MEIFGIRLVGFNESSGKKLLLTFAVIGVIFLARSALRFIARTFFSGRKNLPLRFWTHQAISLLCAFVLVLGLLSVWFNEPAQLTAILGFFSAGVAFALQKVITAFAGYLVILRGKTFSVGDRILMGGVRGDVIALGFMQTKIMEMGQPPSVQTDKPAMWVKSRQFTGRIVTVTNDKVFDEPIYNYTHDFPYIWEEISLPIAYRFDRATVERVLIESARKHALSISSLTQKAVEEMQRRYDTDIQGLGPKVYLRITDNWLEFTVRFIVHDHGTRSVKDAMTREILDALDRAGIGIASATYEIVGVPPLQVKLSNGNARQ
jgi:small-conductance mechanosensitive channel